MMQTRIARIDPNVIDPDVRVSSPRGLVSRRTRNAQDLLVLVVLALVLPGVPYLPIALVRVPLGIALVLGAPGYALAAAIFPDRRDLDGVTRAALSFGLSVAIVPVLALVLNALPWGIRPWPISLSLSLWILSLCAIAMARRRMLDPSGVADPVIAVDLPGLWRGAIDRLRTSRKWQMLAIAGVLVVTLVILLFPDSTARTTEFYLLGGEGQAEAYPRSARPGADVTATIGIVNQEGTQHAYRIEVWAVDPLGSHQRTLVRQDGPILLPPGHRSERPVSWRMPWAGSDQEIGFLLYDEDKPNPYRQLQLWLNVGP
jgi:uncharacterized membrane protein